MENLAAGGAAAEQRARDDDWTVGIQPDATLLVRHRHAPVVKAKHTFWAENAKWVESRFAAGPIQEGEGRFTGAIPKLDLEAAGTFRRLARNAVRVEYTFHAAKGHPAIHGGGITWQLALDSPSFDHRPSVPVLLDDQKGWKWPLGPNQAITVRFDAPLDWVKFERNQKSDPWTFFYAKTLPLGARALAYTIELPDGAEIAPTDAERYGPTETSSWFRDALAWDDSPVDVSRLFADERPAGRHGFLHADGERVIFQDGTPARFWGSNLAAYALFNTPREHVPRQAHRMAQLGFNLMRVVHVDAPWVKVNLLDSSRGNTRHLNPKGVDALDWWVKCMKDEGIYVWLEFIYLRTLLPGDGVRTGFDEIARKKGNVFGFSYFNPDVRDLMREFQQQLLNHVNPYTRLAYKDDPAVIGMLITNENDLTFHFGNIMLANQNNPVHHALFMKEIDAFARQTGLPRNRLAQTWLPGPSKIFLNEMEHRFNRVMIGDVRSLGVRVPIATTNYWGGCQACCLPALTDGDIIDVHSYGTDGELEKNPHYEASFISLLAARVQGKPMSITEWGVPFPETDRFTTPLHVASVAALQGWEVVMHYNYSQVRMIPPGKEEWRSKIDKWSSYNDPTLCGVMPAAAVLFRRGHVAPARERYCLELTPEQLFNQNVSAAASAVIRTIVEQSRLSIALPAVKELPWLERSAIPAGVTVLTDLAHDMIPAGQTFIRSDTGELTRHWKDGILTIDSPRSQAAVGWIGGKTLELGAATFRFRTPKAVVALTSLDDKPLTSSRFILITAVARSVPVDYPNAAEWNAHLPFLSEPAVGEIVLKTELADPQLLALGPDHRIHQRLDLQKRADGVSIRLPTQRGTHWYLIRPAGTAEKAEVGTGP